MISHWDDVRTWRGERGHIAGTWSSLTGRASHDVGLKRIQVDPGMWSTPLHLEGAEEEIFYVLAGSGVSVQWEEEEAPVGYEVRAGDCIVHLALRNSHTLQAGPDGLDVLAFGQRTLRVPASPGCRARASPGSGRPGRRSAPRRTTPGPVKRRPARPRSASSRRDRRTSSTSPISRPSSGTARRSAAASAIPGREAGSDRTGIRHAEVFPGKLNAPPHCHSAEEEIFVVLEGDGHLLLWEDDGVAEHAVRAGSVVVRPAATGVAHAFRGGADGMSLLMYGMRDPARSSTTRAPGRCTSSGSTSSPASASSSTTGTARTDVCARPGSASADPGLRKNP